MKRIVLALFAAAAFVGCNNSDTGDATKDAKKSVDAQKDAVDANTKDAKKQMDANADAAKAQLDADKKKIDAAATTTNK